MAATLNPDDKFTNRRLISAGANWLKNAVVKLVQPLPGLGLATERRARLLCTFLVVLTGVLLTFTPLSAINRTTPRIFLMTLVFSLGGMISYHFARQGKITPALWIICLTSLICLAGYSLSSPVERPENVYLDFRTAGVLMCLPLVMATIAGGLRVGIALLVCSLAVFAGVAAYIINTVGEPSAIVNYFWSVRAPFGFQILVIVLAILFERNILKLLDFTNNRNQNLQQSAGELTQQRQKLEALVENLQARVRTLQPTLLEQANKSREQYNSILDVSTQLDQVGRFARRIDNLATQSEQVGSEAVSIAIEGIEIIKTNLVVYSRLQQHLELLTHSLEELTSEARKVERVVGSMSEIAEETNLLALNAEIEAAGYREHSRRFAAISLEVGRLAQRAREAVDQVSRAVTQIQDSVATLYQNSRLSQDEAVNLLRSTRASSHNVELIHNAVQRSASNSQPILAALLDHQNRLLRLVEDIPSLSLLSDDALTTANEMVVKVIELEKSVANLANQTNAALESDLENEAHDQWEEELLLSSNWLRNLGWFETWQEITAPNRRMTAGDTRRLQLLNKLMLVGAMFDLTFIPFLMLISFNITLILAFVAILILFFTVFVLGKIGYYFAAISLFASGILVAYLGIVYTHITTFELLDHLKTTSALLGVTVLSLALFASLRWIVAVTAIYSFTLFLIGAGLLNRPVLELFPTLSSGIAFIFCMGLIAILLHASVSRLTEFLELQNLQLTYTNRALKVNAEAQQIAEQQVQTVVSDILQLWERHLSQSGNMYEQISGLKRQIERAHRGIQLSVTNNRQNMQSASEALQQAQSGARETQYGITVIQQFQRHITRISQDSTELHTLSRDIGQTFELIGEVAEETDLLALNATVEAAQAYEVGKRFSAVAGEVQRLASRSRLSSQNVYELVDHVKVAVGLCVDLADKGQQEVALLSRAASETGRSVHEILQISNNRTMLLSQTQEALQQQVDDLDFLVSQLQYQTALETPESTIEQFYSDLEQLANLALGF